MWCPHKSKVKHESDHKSLATACDKPQVPWIGRTNKSNVRLVEYLWGSYSTAEELGHIFRSITIGQNVLRELGSVIKKILLANLKLHH